MAPAKTVPGYRGDQVLTSLPPYEGEGAPIPSNGAGKIGGSDLLYTRHWSVRLDGVVQTGGVNLDRLQRDSQNTIIIHHLEGWPQAKDFKATLAAEFARRNPGQKHSEHLSGVLYPFVNNVRDATYRMVKNSFPGAPEGGTAPVAAILEHWSVDADRILQFLDT